MADMNGRVSPLVPLTAIWEKNSVSRYPETVRIPMDDGHVINYRIDVEQPHPCFLRAIDLIRSMGEGGYQFKTADCDGSQRRGIESNGVKSASLTTP